MFCYLARPLVYERLRMCRSTSYRIFGASQRIRSDYVLDLLNRSRRGPQAMLEEIPSDLRTPAEIAALVADSGITERMIRMWVRRREKNRPPCFRINQHYILIRESAFLDWLDALSRPRRYIYGELMYERKRETEIILRQRY